MMRTREQVLAERQHELKMTERNVQAFIVRAQTELEFIIMATPTGPAREACTEANIHLGEALNKIKEWNAAIRHITGEEAKP